MSLLNVVASQKPRQIAARILHDCARTAEFVENRLEVELGAHPLSPVDRGLCHELVHGVVRWQGTLDWLIARKTAGRTQKEMLRILLRLGLYQMFWLDRIPNHAAVNETVELARQLGLGSQAGFVNAVLRGYGREREATEALLAGLKTSDPALGYSHPAWLVERWQHRWGTAAVVQLLTWNNTPPPTYARVNLLRTTAEELGTRWVGEQVRFVPRRYDWAGEDLVFELESHPPLATLPSFQAGLFYIQDPSTLLAVRLLDPRPGESLLDLCAAPGGKTTFAAQLMLNQGRIVAQDNNPDRLVRVRENCDRLGVKGVVTETASSLAQLQARTPKFDRVLLDAPCSNTGVMRRRVDLRWRIEAAEIARLQIAQAGLLRHAAAALRPGGTLVYSTCSMEPEENGGLVAAFLAEHPGYQLEQERQLLPFQEGLDGAYVARLRAPGNPA